MKGTLELHEIVDRYIHKLVALHEVFPYQMTMAAVVAHKSAEKHKKFLDENAEKIEEDEEKNNLTLNDIKKKSDILYKKYIEYGAE